MSELQISEVFYNPEASTGAKSGVAYKRLMTTTLNAAQKIKNKLEIELPKMVFAMLQLAKNNNLTNLEPEMPTVQFSDGVVNDDIEKIEQWVQIVQNKFGTVLQAIQDIQGVSEEQAQAILTEHDSYSQAQKQTEIDMQKPAVNPLDEQLLNELNYGKSGQDANN